MAEPGSPEQGCYTEHGVSGYGVAVKLTRDEPLGEAAIREVAEAMMLSIAEKCMERGARCIGHIKCHLMTEAGSLKADTIGVKQGAYSTGRIERPVGELYLAVNSIVQGIKESEVRAATLDGIHEVAEGSGLAVEKEKEHAYFDEFDFTTSKQQYLQQLRDQLDGAASGEPEGEASR